MKHIFEIEDPRARREVILRIHENRDLVQSAYSATWDKRPEDTVQTLIDRIGEDRAIEAIAETVNSISLHDGRIYDRTRAWANSVESAATHAELEELRIYGSQIHSTHVDQIGDAMRRRCAC